jgi:hypothetical protein
LRHTLLLHELMLTSLLPKQYWLAFTVIGALLCSTATGTQAQINPFSIHTNTSAHLNYGFGTGAANRAQARWARYNQALAASGGKDLMFRFELGGGIIMTKASVDFSLRTIHNSEVTHDTSMSYVGKPVENGYRVAWGSGRPLATLSEDAALMLSYGMSYDNVKWAIPKMTIEGREPEFNFSTNTIGIPLYLDYKQGAEAMLDIEKRICLTVGAGVLPAYTLTVGDNKGNDGMFTVRPTARVEAGLATKIISFKLQATGVFGNMNYLNKSDLARDVVYLSGNKENYDIRLQGHSQFIISLVILATTQSWQYKPWFR